MKITPDSELAKLSKDVSGLIELFSESKDRVIKIEKDVAKQGRALKSMQVQQALGQTGRRLLARMSKRVKKLELSRQLDHDYIKTNTQAMREMSRHLSQTVAANDL